MIVDDEHLIRKGLTHMIINSNEMFSEIKEASDGVEALELLESFQPDLLITDIVMPEMDGLELIREAQKRDVDRFVILSGYDDFKYAQQAIRLHVTDYLLKPIDQNALSDLLSKIVSQIIQERKHRLVHFPIQIEKHLDENNTIRKFKLFILENYMHDISLDEVAECLDLHPNYVSSLIGRKINKSFVHYLHEIRIENAKKILIKQYDLPLKKVANKVGYVNSRNFYKKFKEFVGKTPGSYRNEVIQHDFSLDD